LRDAACFRLDQTVSLALERDTQEAPHLRLVLDQQYEFFIFSHDDL
jgi:hypothetical protein